jgi:glycosyltransferase involved in cell wall biosynthesis
VAGSGPLEGEIRERALRLGLDVTFLGHLSGEALHEAIRSSRAVVAPSEWYENQPYAVLEAFALGVPVAGSAIGGIPELVVEGETGSLFPSGNTERLAEVLERLHLDPASTWTMGQTARARIEREFGARAAVERLMGLYAEVVGGRLEQPSI